MDPTFQGKTNKKLNTRESYRKYNFNLTKVTKATNLPLTSTEPTLCLLTNLPLTATEPTLCLPTEPTLSPNKSTPDPNRTYPVSPTSKMGSPNWIACPIKTTRRRMLCVHTTCSKPATPADDDDVDDDDGEADGLTMAWSKASTVAEVLGERLNRHSGLTLHCLKCFSITSWITAASSGLRTRPASSM